MESIPVIYDALLKVDVSLDFDSIPTPAYLQDKIFECSREMHKVEKYSIEATRDSSSKEKMFRLERANIEIKKRQLLTGNESIKKKPTGKEREAAADELLEKELANLLTLENEVNELKNLLTAIKLVQQNLKGTNSDIKMLGKLMEQQINRLNVGLPDDPEVQELSQAFSEIDELEDEMTLDDVESSEESIDTYEAAGESNEETPETDTSEEDSQDEVGTVLDDDNGGVATEDDLNIESFLLEDEEITGLTDFDEEPVDVTIEEAQKPEQVAQSEDSGGETPEPGDSKGSDEAVEESSGDLDMDIGIDLDIEDVASDSSPIVEESSEVLIESDVVEKKESPPEEKTEVSIPAEANEEDDGIDIDAILTSMD